MEVLTRHTITAAIRKFLTPCKVPEHYLLLDGKDWQAREPAHKQVRTHAHKLLSEARRALKEAVAARSVPNAPYYRSPKNSVKSQEWRGKYSCVALMPNRAFGTRCHNYYRCTAFPELSPASPSSHHSSEGGPDTTTCSMSRGHGPNVALDKHILSTSTYL